MTEDNEDLKKHPSPNQTETINKLGKIGKITLYGSISVVWGVVAVLGIIDLWNNKGILETPWVIFGLVLTVLILVIVIIPLFANVKTQVKQVMKEKEEKINTPVKEEITQ